MAWGGVEWTGPESPWVSPPVGPVWVRGMGLLPVGPVLVRGMHRTGSWDTAHARWQ